MCEETPGIAAREFPQSLVTQIGQESSYISSIPAIGLAGRQIVVAIDRSECALHALNWALDELYRSNDTIHIVRAQPLQLS